MTTTVLNTKIRKVENKIPDQVKYVTTPKFNEFSGTKFDSKLKQILQQIVMLILHHNVLKNNENMEKLLVFDLGYFLGKIVFGDDGFQNMCFYQTTVSTLELKKKKTRNILLVENPKEHILLNLLHHIVLSCVT